MLHEKNVQVSVYKLTPMNMFSIINIKPLINLWLKHSTGFPVLHCPAVSDSVSIKQSPTEIKVILYCF